jgi:hypothetical protein
VRGIVTFMRIGRKMSQNVVAGILLSSSVDELASKDEVSSRLAAIPESDLERQAGDRVPSEEKRLSLASAVIDGDWQIKWDNTGEHVK